MKLTSGIETEFMEFEISRDFIIQFSNSISNSNPIHHDIDYARALGFSDLVAPPTLPIIIWNFIDVSWINEIQFQIIHGEQSFTYLEPIIAGEKIYCKVSLDDVVEKQGKRGKMTIFKQSLKGFKNKTKFSDPFFVSDTSLIVFK